MRVTSGAEHDSPSRLRRDPRAALAALAILLLPGCAGIPGGLDSVSGFLPERYLGRWYEIARLDHRFERGLVNVTAEYRKRADGDITVTNRGFDPKEGKWREAKGLAKFVGDPSRGRLKVSFFGPFYGGYNIVALDEQYRWAMVVGPTTDYLWILSRTPQLDKRTLEALVAKAKAAGFATDQLIYVDQSPRSRGVSM
jgi:apolipoprotein D and lipocalin family protein